MNRLSIVGVLLATMLATKAEAQVWSEDEVGYPMRIMSVYLENGKSYDFRTDYTLTSVDGGYADTILSLVVSPSGPAGAGMTTLLGADGCNIPGGSFDWAPSCFHYAHSGSTGSYWLILRAWRASSPAQTKVWQREGTGAWISLGGSLPYTAGGGSESIGTLGTSHVHFTTAFQGGENSGHMLLVTRSGGTVEWDTVFYSSDSTIVTRLAEFDVPNPSVYGSFSARIAYGGEFNTGPMRLLKNDWFVPGRDVDQDGLGHALEQSLGTCDRVGDVMPNGISCGSFEFCDISPTGDVCEAQLRDTDHDGLRDDVEVYGYDTFVTEMPRYGANPVHKDVFIELDTYDRDPSTPMICDGFDLDLTGNLSTDVRFLGGDGLNFFDQAQAIYDAAPAWMNPDGQPGISLHFDVGVRNPDPTDTRWGGWGQGNTCAMSGRYTDVAATAFNAARPWLFRWGIDGGGAQTNGTRYTALSTSQHVHEIGHTLALSHSGPRNAATNYGGTFGRVAGAEWGGNRRPLFPSRMSYRFQDFANSPSASGTWTGMTFSPGSWRTQMSARFADEQDPVPEEPFGTILGYGEPSVDALNYGNPADVASPDVATSTWTVDWDGSGGPIDTSPTHMDSLRDTSNKIARWSADFDRNIAYGTHSDAIIVGDLLIHAYVRYDELLGGVFPITHLRADRDGDCPLIPTRDTPGAQAYYPRCIEFGDGYEFAAGAQGVSAAPTLLPNGKEGFLLIGRYDPPLHTSSKVLQYEIYPEPSFNEFEATYAISEQELNWPLPTDNIVLLQTGSGVLAVFESGGDLWQSYRTGAGAWQAAEKATMLGGANFGDPECLPGLATHAGDVYLVAKPGTGFLHTYKWSSSGPENLRSWSDLGPIPNTNNASFVEAASTPPPTGSTTPEFHVFFRQIFDDKLATTRTTDFVNYLPLTVGTGIAGHRGQSAIALTYDTRGGTPPGLRGFYDEYQTGCVVDSDCEGQLHECDSGVCISAALDDRAVTHVVFAPFMEGIDPTEYCDYDDWRGLDWGICETLGEQSAPTATSHFVLTPYELPIVCQPRRVYPEPDEFGFCGANSSILAAGESDRTLHPEWYGSPQEVTCSE